MRSEAHHGSDQSKVAAILNNLALIYLDRKENQRAEQLLNQAVHILDENARSSDSALAAFPNNLGILYRSDGRLPEAEAQLRRAIDIWGRALGPRTSGCGLRD